MNSTCQIKRKVRETKLFQFHERDEKYQVLASLIFVHTVTELLNVFFITSSLLLNLRSAFRTLPALKYGVFSATCIIEAI